MANYLQILINNDMGLGSKVELYLYIIGEVENSGAYDYYSYKLSTDGNVVATMGDKNKVYAIPFSSLKADPKNPGVSHFNFDQSQAFSGRIWFSTSKDLLTISSLQVNQPNPSGGLLFDFTELTITAGSSVNCDTTQVVGLGIPITIINPTVLAFPPSGKMSAYTYPNAIGIVPGNSLSSICKNFTGYANAIGLSEFSDCVQTYTAGTKSDPVQWLINPGYQVPVYEAGQTPQGLSICMDEMIFQFFNYYYNSKNSLSITFEGVVYTGTVVIQAGFDSGAPKQEYCALCFVDPSNNQYPIFYPYFNTNSATSQGGTLNPDGVLPPPPSWWSTNGLASNIPASGQVFLCNGVFNDGNTGAYISSKTILAALQNLVVTMLNRGMVPGATMNNLFACTGNLALIASPVYFTDNSPADSTSVVGATLLYTPTQIPPNTTASTCNVSGSIQLKKGSSKGTTLTQQFVGPHVDPPATLPNNYCTTPIVNQLITDPTNSQDQLVQFAFQYVNAVWPDGVPSLVAPVNVKYFPDLPTEPTASFSGTGFPSGIQKGMNVLDANVQNPSFVSSVGTDTLTIQSTINGILPSPNTDTLIIGNFFPVKDNAALGCWNAYAAFLHYGGNGIAAPYISNQGYAFAYDDDGGYSSDITVNFPESGNCSLAIYLGPLS